MPPLRGARAARANRGQTDVDIMEGLPVRQWRKQPVVMNKNPQKDALPESNDQNPRWRELPMPKGSDLYPPWSQALLRAARAGRILQRHSGTNDEDKDGREDEDADGDLDASFTANRWNQLSKETEEPETEYLAKRRRGLPTLYGGWATDGGNITMRKCRIKKFDAEGHPYVLEVLIPETTTIDGEMEENEDIPVQLLPAGTVVEGLGIANAEGIVVANEHMMPTPPRRRPPIPKRKPKGPGRGRKKKVIVEDGANGAATAVNATTADGSTAVGASALNPDGTKVTGESDGLNNADGDGDNDGDGDGDDGSDDDDDDGEDGDENDREDGELSDGEDASRSASPVKAAPKLDSPLKADISASLLGTSTAVPDVEVTPAASEAAPNTTEPILSATPLAESPLVQEEIAKDKDVPMADAPLTTANETHPAIDLSIQKSDEPLEDEISQIPISPREVEMAESDQPAIQAEIPEDHNPLEGLAEPQPVPIEMAAEAQEHKEDPTELSVDKEEVTTKDEAVENTSEAKVDVPEKDSDVSAEKSAAAADDIFGSLERHLDGQDKQN